MPTYEIAKNQYMTTPSDLGDPSDPQVMSAIQHQGYPSDINGNLISAIQPPSVLQNQTSPNPINPTANVGNNHVYNTAPNEYYSTVENYGDPTQPGVIEQIKQNGVPSDVYGNPTESTFSKIKKGANDTFNELAPQLGTGAALMALDATNPELGGFEILPTLGRMLAGGIGSDSGQLIKNVINRQPPENQLTQQAVNGAISGFGSSMLNRPINALGNLTSNWAIPVEKNNIILRNAIVSKLGEALADTGPQPQDLINSGVPINKIANYINNYNDSTENAANDLYNIVGKDAKEIPKFPFNPNSNSTYTQPIQRGLNQINKLAADAARQTKVFNAATKAGVGINFNDLANSGENYLENKYRKIPTFKQKLKQALSQ